jgi:hypothetical protein
MSVEPELAGRLAKLLRMVCDRGVDGETLAAASRLSAIVAAYGVDWDLALNGGGPTRDQMQEVYDSGYERGLADGRAEVQPEWAPVPAANSTEHLQIILKAATNDAATGVLTSWEADFSASVRDRLFRYGRRLRVTPKMWAVLDRIETKLRYHDLID